MTDITWDLNDLLDQLTPSLLTPHLGEISQLANDKKPKRVAQLLVRAMHGQLGKPVMKEILHNGSIHQMRYFDIEPMMKGSWCELSLMLLQLSYGEQCVIIEALYPKDIQLTAKTFASHFTKVDNSAPITIEQDAKSTHLLESANAGISLILATLIEMGYHIAHPDVASRHLYTMESMAKDYKQRQKVRDMNARKDSAMSAKDKQT